jgi:hypothetical protein
MSAYSSYVSKFRSLRSAVLAQNRTALADELAASTKAPALARVLAELAVCDAARRPVPRSKAELLAALVERRSRGG